jgi:nucleotide-binding universal stress UspA family protein
MSTILLATDGSPSALEATREAIRLADELACRLLIVGIEHVTPPAYGYYGYAQVYDELQSGEHIHIERVLAEAAHAADDAGVISETIARKGDVVDSICEIAATKGARLIVIGSHGWTGARRFLFGSVSTGVLHHAPCPVIVVREPAKVPENGRVRADATAV